MPQLIARVGKTGTRAFLAAEEGRAQREAYEKVAEKAERAFST